jgi:RNA polymerase sigma-70 factor, ECF subfamily
MTRSPRGADDATDAALIARWAGGDERAASVLVERHADAVKRFVCSLGERFEADEVVQDTFVRAFGALDTFRGESSLRTWLFTIARRLLVDRRRVARRRPEAREIMEGDAAIEHDALDGMVADEAEARVHRAMEKLTPMQREVFALRVGQGVSYKEIAAITGTTEGAARVHYHNAMRAVKEFLDD